MRQSFRITFVLTDAAQLDLNANGTAVHGDTAK